MVRFKRRYLVFELQPFEEGTTKVKLNERELQRAIREAVANLYGDFGLGSVLKSMYVKRFAPGLKVGILTVQRGQHLLVTSSLATIKKVGNLPCSIRTVHLSGTIRGCLRKLKVYHQSKIKDHEDELKSLQDCLTKDKQEEQEEDV